MTVLPQDTGRFEEIGQRRLARLAELDFGMEQSISHVLQNVAEAVTSLLPTSRGSSVILWDAESSTFSLAASTVPGQDSATPVKNVRRSGGATRWVIDNGVPLIVSDAVDHDLATNQMLTKYGIGAFAAVPIASQDRLFGVLYALDVGPTEYRSADVQFLEMLANRAATALSVAALLEDVRATSAEYQGMVSRMRLATRRAETNARLANMLMTTDLDEQGLSVVAATVAQALWAERAVIVTVDQRDEVILTRIAGGFEPVTSDPATYAELMEGPVGRAIRERRPVSFGGFDAEKLPASNRAASEPATAIVPLLSRSGAVGVMMVVRRRGRSAFTGEELSAAELAAAQLSSAIERSRLFSEVERLAITDTLTQVGNRRLIIDQASSMMALAERHERPLSVLVLDIDKFKTINDTHGHQVGDAVLCAVAEVCRRVTRQIDVVGRIGGDEFVILLPESDLAAAHVLAQRLDSAIGELDVGGVECAVSIGVSQWSPSDDFDSMVERADDAMYDAKRSGGGVSAR